MCKAECIGDRNGLDGEFSVNAKSRCSSNCLLRDGRTNAGPQLFHDLSCSFAGLRVLGHVKRNGADTGMASAAIALADLREIYGGRARRPRIRSNRNFHAEAALAQPNTVNRLGMQIIRYEL